MRDIKPAPKPQRPPVLPEAAELLAIPDPTLLAPPAKKTAPRLVGTKVPVASIHVPTSQVSSDTNIQKKQITTATPVKRLLRKPHLGDRERIIIGSLIGLAVIVGILAVIIFLPHAQITLVLRTAPLLVDEKLTLQAAPSTDANKIPGTAFFREVNVEGTSSVTGTKVVGTKATGTVILVNRTVTDQSIKELSRLVTKDGQVFYMQKGVTMPAASGTPTRTPVTVEAAEPGEAGNIEPQKVDFAAIDAASQTLVYGEVETALTGGTGETVPFVTEDDLKNAQQAAGQEARTKVEADIRAELPQKWVILEESWTADITEFDTAVGLGSQETAIPYTARVAVRAMGYEEAALENRLRSALESRLDADYMLFPGQISYTKTVDTINWDDAVATISARVTHTTIPQFQLTTLQDKIAGQSKEQAKQYLEGLPGVRSVALDVSPFWVRSIPRINNRIDLDLIPERQP